MNNFQNLLGSTVIGITAQIYQMPLFHPVSQSPEDNTFKKILLSCSAVPLQNSLKLFHNIYMA
jgi:hypothetical protein